MVTSAAYQGVRWHMWLYYFRNIVEGLVEIYDTSHPSVDTSLEFPTRSARLIYEALYALRQWVLLVSKLPEDSPHRQSDALSENQGWRWSPSFHDNGNIPVSASTALGPCMATIIMSDRIDERFAISLHEGILQTMIDLGRDGKEGRLRSLLIQSIVYGGQPLGLTLIMYDASSLSWTGPITSFCMTLMIIEMIYELYLVNSLSHGRTDSWHCQGGKSGPAHPMSRASGYRG